MLNQAAVKVDSTFAYHGAAVCNVNVFKSYCPGVSVGSVHVLVARWKLKIQDQIVRMQKLKQW